MSIIQNLQSAIQAGWLRRWRSAADVDQIDQAIGNGFQFFQRDSSDANELAVIGYDTDDKFRYGNEVRTPTRDQQSFHIYPNASLATQAFFVNPTPNNIYITGISEVHTTAGSVTGANCYITHETAVGGLMQAKGTGKTVMSGTFDLTATAETVQNATLVANYRLSSRNNSVSISNPGAGTIVLKPGDSLSVKFGTPALTTLVGLTITLYFAPGCKYTFVSYYKNAAGTPATTSLLTSLRPRTLQYAAAFWQVAESTASTLTLDVTKDASGTAPGGGTTMLAATANLKSTALTYTQLTLTATAANRKLISTDSTAVKISASNTELAGLLVTLAFEGCQGEQFLNYNAANSTVGTNEEFFIADRDYEVLDFAAKWSTVSTARIIGLCSVPGTSTPASGSTVLQTDNSSAGFDTSGTINIPVFAALSALNTRFIRQGTRLGLKNDSGTLASLAGFQVSARLRAM